MIRLAFGSGAFGTALLWAAACSDPVGYACPGEVLPAVEIEVHGIREAPPPFSTAEGWVEEGSYVDSLRVTGRSGDELGSVYTLSAAMERPGTYQIHVRKPGYAPWTRDDVQVTIGTCGVETARLKAELAPLP